MAQQIREHMEVLGSDGQHVGVVDKIEGEEPMDWVDHVDAHVHLKKSSHDARREWKPGAN